MRIGVLIPLYNKGELIARCLRSLVAQTHRDLRIYVMDDASTDDSVGHAESVKDKRIAIFKSTYNRGAGAMWNDLMDIAEERWVSLQDADDFSLEDRIARQLRMMDAHRRPWCTCLRVDLSEYKVFNPNSLIVGEYKSRSNLGCFMSTIFPRRPRVPFSEAMAHKLEYVWTGDMVWLYGSPLVVKYWGYVWDDGYQKSRMFDNYNKNKDKEDGDRWNDDKHRMLRNRVQRLQCILGHAREVSASVANGAYSFVGSYA